MNILDLTVTGILAMSPHGSRVEWEERADGWQCTVKRDEQTVISCTRRNGFDAAVDLLDEMWRE